jgi:hypothetical protein
MEQKMGSNQLLIEFRDAIDELILLREYRELVICCERYQTGNSGENVKKRIGEINRRLDEIDLRRKSLEWF